MSPLGVFITAPHIAPVFPPVIAASILPVLADTDESADAGNNKKIIATDIVLSGEMACNYTLSTDTVSM